MRFERDIGKLYPILIEFLLVLLFFFFFSIFERCIACATKNGKGRKETRKKKKKNRTLELTIHQAFEIP